MDKFQVGESYGVLYLDDRDESVTVVAREEMSVKLADGRRAAILHGPGPNGEEEELFRLDEDGALALGGVVRACHRRAAIDSAIALAAKEAK